MEETVFAVLGGNPAECAALCYAVRLNLREGGDARQAIGDYLCDRIINNSCGHDREKLTSLMMNVFGQTGVLPKSVLVANGLYLTEFNQIFSEFEIDGVHALVPASNAIKIVLRHREPELNELVQIVNNMG